MFIMSPRGPDYQIYKKLLWTSQKDTYIQGLSGFGLLQKVCPQDGVKLVFKL